MNDYVIVVIILMAFLNLGIASFMTHYSRYGLAVFHFGTFMYFIALAIKL